MKDLNGYPNFNSEVFSDNAEKFCKNYLGVMN